MIDMHIHSTESDGILNIEDIINISKKYHLDNFAISDHDVLVSKLKFNNSKIIKSVEFGISYKNKEIHILGYFVDNSNTNLNNLVDLARIDRQKRIDVFKEKFFKLGILIDKNAVLNYSKEKIFSRSNLAQYLVDIKICKTKNEAFKKYLSENGKCYVQKNFTTIKEIIDSIKSASGVAILAHPVTINDDIIINEIIDMGIDGIEVINSKHNFADIIKYLNLAINKKLLYTAGSDCHGKKYNNQYLLGHFSINRKIFESISTLHEIRSNYVIKQNE
ncbi:PHP domain-containing protein [uncultured Finegoldia sp.]|uniref:PHP domain-containing protein n=1 Tax=uncultured Finegoldia sp. TaxID=328009 RepID=UPI00260B7BEE|nr:PHP domain-containing protein [uncultured Finegoldia sp.]